MKAIVYEGPNSIAVRDVPLPKVNKDDGWVLVKVAYAGICGSDMTIYSGRHPRAKAPLVLGHEFSGTLVSGHPSIPEGSRVAVFPYIPCGHCEQCLSGNYHVCMSLKIIGIDLDGGMAEYVRVPADTVYPAPENADDKLTAFIEPVSISVHVTRHGGYRPGDSAAVFGAGGIGLSTALTLRSFGAQHVILCEPDENRRALAEDFGFDTVDSGGNDTAEQIYERTNGLGAEYVFDCAGHQSVINVLPDAVKIGGHIIIVAGYKTPPTMDFQKGMFREFDIRFVRNCAREDFEIAMDLVRKDQTYGRLLNCVLPAEEAQAGFSVPKGAYKVLFDMRNT